MRKAAGNKRASWGWGVGIVVGVFVGLWAFPPVRYILRAQAQFALAQQATPWMQAMDTRRTPQELARLDAVAANAPQDYLLQVGRATALAGTMVSHDRPPPGETAPSDDHTLIRLGIVARDFPQAWGATAHLARYMMADRVRLQRVELDNPTSPALRSLPARYRDVRLMEWALRSGEKRDPGNSFWPTMLATTYFAALRDTEGLQALERAARKSFWDAYLYEEVLGQWRLFTAAYGDNGALQKIGPLSFVAFPHLYQIRRMTELARWHADQRIAQGKVAEGLRIRRNIARLGVLMRSTAHWAYEALYGTDLLFIAVTDGKATTRPHTIQDKASWERASQHYRTLLQQSGRVSDLIWLRDEIEQSLILRQRVNLARYDTSYPGIPPGIPLMSLFGNWIAGVCLLQQMGGAILLALLAHLWLSRGPHSPLPSRLHLWLVIGALLVLGWGSLSLLLGVAHPRAIGIYLACLTLLGILGLDRFKATQEPPWRGRTTLSFLLVIVLPGLLLLLLLRPTLSGLHPVAQLLTTALTGAKPLSLGEALQSALLAGLLPLTLFLGAGIYAFCHRASALRGACLGVQKMALPMITCLLFAYLFLLNRTLYVDAQASQAIHEAAQNDLNWVLTHSTPPE